MKTITTLLIAISSMLLITTCQAPPASVNPKLQQELNTCKEQNIILNQKIAKKDSTINDLNEKQADFLTQIIQLKKSNNDLKADNRRLKYMNTNLTKTNELLLKDYNSVNVKLQNANDTLSYYKDSLQVLNENIAELQTAFEDIYASFYLFEKNILDKKVEDLNIRKSSLNEDIKELEDVGADKCKTEYQDLLMDRRWVEAQLALIKKILHE